MGPEVDAASFRARGKDGVIVQTVSDSVPKNEHLYELLAAQTLTAAKSGQLLGRKPEVDLLLRVAGTTQISEALARRRQARVAVRPSRLRDPGPSEEALGPVREGRRETPKKDAHRQRPLDGRGCCLALRGEGLGCSLQLLDADDFVRLQH